MKHKLYRLGKLNEIFLEEDEKCEQYDSEIVTLEKRINEQNEQSLVKISKKLIGVDSDLLQSSADFVTSILFGNKDKDWHRYTSHLHSYIEWLLAHSINTAIISCIIAKTLGYNDTRLFAVGVGALFHDIGLTLLPKEMLLHSNEPSELESIIIHNHCELGFSMMKDTSIPNISKRVILEHHERLDGTGYPSKLLENQILQESMIVMIAGEFDTETTTGLNQQGENTEVVINKMIQQKEY